MLTVYTTGLVRVFGLGTQGVVAEHNLTYLRGLTDPEDTNSPMKMKTLQMHAITEALVTFNACKPQYQDQGLVRPIQICIAHRQSFASQFELAMLTLDLTINETERADKYLDQICLSKKTATLREERVVQISDERLAVKDIKFDKEMRLWICTSQGLFQFIDGQLDIVFDRQH